MIEDQIPVSSNKEIVVEKVEDSGAQCKEDTGAIRWILKLNKGETKKLSLKYSVKLPKDANLILE